MRWSVVTGVALIAATLYSYGQAFWNEHSTAALNLLGPIVYGFGIVAVAAYFEKRSSRHRRDGEST